MSGIVFSFSGRAQTLSPCVVSSAGGYYTSASASLSFTVAEMTMVQTFTSTGNILTQGFQQPEDLSVGIPQSEISLNDYLIYPNPTSGTFTLEFNSASENPVTIKLFNLVGQEILTNNFSASSGINKISLDISNLSQGIYMLEINTGTDNANTTPTIKKINLVY